MDKERIREAVELLVGADNYAAVKKELMGCVRAKGIPRRLAGEYEPLNAPRTTLQ